MKNLDNDGYPTEEYLKYITEYDLCVNDIWELLSEIEDGWCYGDWGFILKNPYTDKLFKKQYRTLELHTGGWSGNEDVIRALHDNSLFFPLYWRRTDVGGHYYFKIPIKTKDIDGRDISTDTNKTAVR
jgi:hypothetical protein